MSCGFDPLRTLIVQSSSSAGPKMTKRSFGWLRPACPGTWGTTSCSVLPVVLMRLITGVQGARLGSALHPRFAGTSLWRYHWVLPELIIPVCLARQRWPFCYANAEKGLSPAMQDSACCASFALYQHPPMHPPTYPPASFYKEDLSLQGDLVPVGIKPARRLRPSFF